VDRFGSTHLTENRRQTSEVDRELVDALTQGDHARASAILKESQRLKVADTRSSALNLLIADWGEDAARRHASGERLSPIIAATNASVYDANVQCQQELRQRGVITADAKRVRHKDQWLHVGDRVMITKTSRRLDLNHGELGRVMKITQRLRRTTLTIALDRGGDAKVSLKKFGHVRLGYAMTAHQSQGRSLSDNVYVLLGGKPQDRELTLTAASRTSGSTFFYDRPVEPGAGFERHAEVSRQKQMAAAAMHLAMDEAQRKRSRSE
jgi:ATP-dependent exoDNAse (exonuclease V) alpha subunit